MIYSRVNKKRFPVTLMPYRTQKIRQLYSSNDVTIHLQMRERLHSMLVVLLITSLVHMTSSEYCRKSISRHSKRNEIKVSSDCLPGVKMRALEHTGKTALGKGLIEEHVELLVYVHL